MGASQRTKGAAYEREIANYLGKRFGAPVKRNISQARDGGDDIPFGPFLIECKRRKRMETLYGWVRQIERACASRRKVPLVVCRADNEQSLVVMRLDDFTALLARVGKTVTEIETAFTGQLPLPLGHGD